MELPPKRSPAERKVKSKGMEREEAENNRDHVGAPDAAESKFKVGEGR